MTAQLRSAAAGSPNPRPWVLPEPAAGSGLRLFCFPHAGAGASTYRPWIRELAPAGITVCPVQLPGRENRFGEPPYDRLPPLVAALGSALREYARPPFAFFGHSLGALVAYELTRAWRREGGPEPRHVFVSGRIAPHLPDPRPALHPLPDRELRDALLRLGGLPPAMADQAPLVALHLPLVRADLAVNETYRHVVERPLGMPVTAFGGSADPKVDPAELHAWREHTTGPFRAALLPGGHFYLHSAAPLLLAHLRADLLADLRPAVRLAS